uniref:Uncharacterized protein n=1 Tax=Anguilla anguilla TaxID=7936 RepID=A0A0E9TXG0_ANGAN
MKLPSLMPSNHTSCTVRHFPVFTVFKGIAVPSVPNTTL